MTSRKNNISIKKNSFELSSWAQNQVVCGVDEAGRGCFAGPVIVGAAILPPNTSYKLLKDSKIMTKHELKEAFMWLQKHALYAWSSIDNTRIDEINIYQATLQAMKRACLQLFSTCPIKPTHILVDAMPLKLDNTHYSNVAISSFPYGEQWSSSIAAASIIAKVMRDTLMHSMHHLFPEYELEKHKGYGTALHQQALLQRGPSIIHRVSYISGIVQSPKATNEYCQQTIC